LPALRQQVRGQLAADDAAGADDEGVFMHASCLPKEKSIISATEILIRDTISPYS
jgi:hypothetical protein